MTKMTSCVILLLIGFFLSSISFTYANEQNLEDKMTKEEALALHQQMGIEYFNQSWELLEKPDRTKADEDVLINLVHTSLYHWRQLDQPINILRGEWMIAHVYTLLKHKESALYHANNTLQWADTAKATDWDLAYAYEAMARAQALNGNKAEYQQYYEMAVKAGKDIKEEGDRTQFEADLNDANWFGMK